MTGSFRLGGIGLRLDEKRGMSLTARQLDPAAPPKYTMADIEGHEV